MNKVLFAQCMQCPSQFSCEPLWKAFLDYIDAYTHWYISPSKCRSQAGSLWVLRVCTPESNCRTAGRRRYESMCRLEVPVVHCRCASAVAATLIDSVQILCIEVELFGNVCSCAGKAIISLTAKLDARPKDGPLTDYYIWFAWLHGIFVWLLRLHIASCSLITFPQERGVVLSAS